MKALAQVASRPHLPTSFSPQVLITNFMDPVIELERQMHASGAGIDDQDFNDSANPLWSLYGKKAKDYDKATLDDITSGMEGLLLFVRSLSSTLPLL